MKLMIITHTREDDTGRPYGWVHRGTRVLPKLGIDVKYVYKHEWGKVMDYYHEFKPDIILTIGPYAAYILWLRKNGKFGNTIIGHDWHDDYVKTMGRKWTPWLMKKTQEYILQNSDFVSTPSLSRYNHMKETLDKPLYHWMHGADTELFQSGKDKEQYPKDKTVFFYAGEISFNKHVDRIVLAVNKNKDAHLVMYGRVVDEWLLRLAENNSEYRGMFEFKDMYKYTKGADVLVLTQDNDSAIKLSQYFASRKAVIGPTGDLNSFKDYIYLNEDFDKLVSEMVYYKQNKMLRPKQQYMIKDEDYYMTEYKRFLEGILEKREQHANTNG